MYHNKKKKSMVEITKDYEAFIKGKKLNVNGKDLFDKTLKKVIKQHDSKVATRNLRSYLYENHLLHIL